MAEDLITGVTKNELIGELLAMARNGLLPASGDLSPTRKYCIEQGFIEEVGRENKRLIISPAGLEKLMSMAAEERDSKRIKAFEEQLQGIINRRIAKLFSDLVHVADADTHMLARFRGEAFRITVLEQVQDLLAGKATSL